MTNPTSYGQDPWHKRRQALAVRIAQRGEQGLAVNIKYTLKTNTNEPSSKDLARFIRDGFARLSHKTGPARQRPYKLRPGKQHKCVHLTNQGWKLIPAQSTPSSILIG